LYRNERRESCDVSNAQMAPSLDTDRDDYSPILMRGQALQMDSGDKAVRENSAHLAQ